MKPVVRKTILVRSVRDHMPRRCRLLKSPVLTLRTTFKAAAVQALIEIAAEGLIGPQDDVVHRRLS
ncbi:hypothetical protein, partial [Mesorhizobium tamadayense]|uniref:hypothetical protein n=1 Tax=Mesorhizobium tamadayense TaxID=425306 RepID=UPI00197EDF9F